NELLPHPHLVLYSAQNRDRDLQRVGRPVEEQAVDGGEDLLIARQLTMVFVYEVNSLETASVLSGNSHLVRHAAVAHPGDFVGVAGGDLPQVSQVAEGRAVVAGNVYHALVIKHGTQKFVVAARGVQVALSDFEIAVGARLVKPLHTLQHER